MGTASPLIAAARFQARLVGRKIRIDAPYSDAMQEFLHTLPACRWDRRDLCWKCDATPAAAWRLLFGEVRFAHDEDLFALAMRIQQAQLGSGEEPGMILQPARRKSDLWRHQLEGYRFAKGLDATLLHMGMGTGKSLLAIALLVNRDCKTCLIACPKSVIGVWRREFQKHCPVEHEILLLDKGTVAQKTKQLEKALIRASSKEKLLVAVVNYESAWRDPLYGLAAGYAWDAVICDESHRIKGHTSRQSKAMAEIGEKARCRLALTGTPMANSPMDVFAQFRFLDPGVFGTSYHAFRSRYAVTGHFGADHIVGFRNQDELAARMRLLTFHADRSVLDLPPVQHITIPVSLGPETERVYRGIEKELIAQVEEGVVTAANALVKTLRLQQITGGFVQDDEGALRVTGTEKRDALVDLLEGMDQPCVVFCKFLHDLDSIAAAAQEAGRAYGELSGRRKDLNEHAQMQDGIDVMGVQVRSGGVGVDLTRAPYAVYYNHPWSLGDYDQSACRVHRPGQDKPVVYYHLLADETVDAQVWKALEKKRDVVETVIAYMKGELNAAAT